MILGKLLIPGPQVSTSFDFKNGLLRCYELDETSGTTAYNSYGGTNNGTIYGAALNQAGKLGTAFSFDGTDDYVSIPISGLNTQQGTITVWLNNNTSLTDKRMFFYGGTYRTYVMFLVAGSNLQWEWRNSGGTTHGIYTTGGQISSNGWYHLCVTTNGSRYLLYINGSSVSFTVFSGSNSGNWMGDLTSPTAARIASFLYNNLQYYKEQHQDQTAIWNRELPADEIAALYNSGNGLAYSNW